MRRYLGTGLPPQPKVAVIANDAIGNFVVATPLLQMVRRELAPEFIHYFGGTRTLEFQIASNLFERSFALHHRAIEATLAEVDVSYDLIINVEQGDVARQFTSLIAGSGQVCGPAEGLEYPTDARGDLWRDREWVAPDLTSKYPFLESGWIAEIYARLSYLEGPVPLYQLPAEPVDHEFDVLIATTASLPEKLWPFESWVATLRWMSEMGLKVGLLGAPPKLQGEHWKGADDETRLVETTDLFDCRGLWSLPGVVGAIGGARAVLTLDNGIMHLGAATTTPTVGLFRHGIHRLWTPPVPTVHPVVAEPESSVADIPIHAVQEVLERVL